MYHFTFICRAFILPLFCLVTQVYEYRICGILCCLSLSWLTQIIPIRNISQQPSSLFPDYLWVWNSTGPRKTPWKSLAAMSLNFRSWVFTSNSLLLCFWSLSYTCLPSYLLTFYNSLYWETLGKTFCKSKVDSYWATPGNQITHIHMSVEW